MSKRNEMPIYMQVAIDVASRIISNEIKENSKISGRTTLASEYNVSPETIRKAMRLLSDMNIVEVKPGNGIFVTSAEHSKEFIERYHVKSNINGLKEALIELTKQRQDIDDKMNTTINSIIDYSSRFKNTEHIAVNEYSVDFDSVISKRALAELDLWSNSGVTVVGIIRNGTMILSPGPSENLELKDRLFYVGNESSSVRLGEFLRNIFL